MLGIVGKVLESGIWDDEGQTYYIEKDENNGKGRAGLGLLVPTSGYLTIEG